MCGSIKEEIDQSKKGDRERSRERERDRAETVEQLDNDLPRSSSKGQKHDAHGQSLHVCVCVYPSSCVCARPHLKVLIVDAKPFAQIAEHQRAVLLELKMAWHVFPGSTCIFDLNTKMN